MTNNKMTKRDWFEIIKGIVTESDDNRIDEINAFIDHEIELLNRKSNKTSETTTQKENKIVKNIIRQVLHDIGRPVTISELQKDERLAGYSNQKLSALVNRMEDVEKIIDKKKSFFTLK